MFVAFFFRYDVYFDVGGRSVLVWLVYYYRIIGMVVGDGVYGNWLADWFWFR